MDLVLNSSNMMRQLELGYAEEQRQEATYGIVATLPA